MITGEVRLWKLTRRQVRERLAAGQMKAAILPTGSTEQHNEHLAMEHDTVSALVVAEQAALSLFPDVVVATPMPVGISEHWMEWKGTLSLRPDTFFSVAFDTCEAAVARKADVAIIDTAGRLQTHDNLMAELDKIHRVMGRVVVGAPHEVLLVLDGTTGQNGLRQAEQFLRHAGVTGLVLAKLDGTAKGGVALTIAHRLALPIRFVGTGESADDLASFDAAGYVEALIGETDG